jgi:septal ring factor EnvC (AmiA/AmiB activator)|tara:strand:- start:1421 stop:1768 length:348 start_codon:yes stop_codon:yes gene_type:complete
MDESSLRILLTLGGMIASVAAAFAVVRQSVKTLTETLADVEVRLRRLDSKIDRLETEFSTVGQRLNILAQMSSPDSLERRHRELGDLLARLGFIEKDVASIKAMHNGKHPKNGEM